MPVLFWLTTVAASAAPRAGVAAAYSGQLVPGVANATMSDFFQICTNNNGECAFVVRCKVGTSNFSDYIMSNGGLGRTAAPVVIKSARNTLLCLQNAGSVVSVADGGFYVNQNPVSIPGLAGSQMGASALAEGCAAFVVSSPDPVMGTVWAGLTYNFTSSFLNPVAFNTSMSGSFAAAARLSNSLFLIGPEKLDLSRKAAINGPYVRFTNHTLRAGAVTSNGHSVLNVVQQFPNATTFTRPKPAIFRKPNGTGIAVEVTRAGEVFGGVTIADNTSPFTQIAIETTGIPVFLAQTSLPLGNAVIRAAATPTALLKSGSAAPGITGAVIDKVINFALDEAGNCVIHATIAGPGAAIGEALFRSTSGSAAVLFAQTGDTVTVNGSTKTITGFGLQSVFNEGVSIGPRIITPNGRVAAYLKFGNDRAAFVFDAQ
jgi:hypothetical protein